MWAVQAGLHGILMHADVRWMPGAVRSHAARPVFAVIMRYNLVSGGLCTETWAHVWSSALPWATAWTLYQGSVTLKLLSWSGLVLNGFIDFLMPGLVTLVSLGIAQRLRRAWRGGRLWCTGARSGVRGAAEVEEAEALSHPASSLSPVAPFPPWLRPFYLEVVAAMVVFLLLLLPIAVWLQLVCANSRACYPAEEHDHEGR